MAEPFRSMNLAPYMLIDLFIWLCVLVGSVLPALVGLLVLHLALPKERGGD